MQPTALFSLVAALPFVLGTAIPAGSLCASPTELARRFVGRDKNVELTHVRCANTLLGRASNPIVSASLLGGDPVASAPLLSSPLVTATTIGVPTSAATTSVVTATPVNPNPNVCGATCDTNCFLPSGGGPNPNDCSVIADALLYDSENVGTTFDIAPTSPTNSAIFLKFRSCETFMVNQDVNALTYCRADWSALVNYIAPNCQATQNAHGGNCVARDKRWFIQVQHS
jgi:hypothetical protein